MVKNTNSIKAGPINMAELDLKIATEQGRVEALRGLRDELTAQNSDAEIQNALMHVDWEIKKSFKRIARLRIDAINAKVDGRALIITRG